MKITRPEPKVKIPESAHHSQSVITHRYTWKNENGELIRRNKRADIIKIIPITTDKKALVIELTLPSKNKENRILEKEISDNFDIFHEAKNLLSEAGLKYKNIKLLVKGQPFDIGEYPLDCAMYVFIAEHVSVKNNPSLDYQVPYRFTEKEVSDFIEEIETGKIKNRELMPAAEELEAQLL
jgi:hypothetical protein